MTFSRGPEYRTHCVNFLISYILDTRIECFIISRLLRCVYILILSAYTHRNSLKLCLHWMVVWTLSHFVCSDLSLSLSLFCTLSPFLSLLPSPNRPFSLSFTFCSKLSLFNYLNLSRSVTYRLEIRIVLRASRRGRTETGKLPRKWKGKGRTSGNETGNGISNSVRSLLEIR